MIQVGSPHCKECKLHETADVVCETGTGNPKGSILVVSRMPNSKSYVQYIERELESAGIPLDACYFTSVLKCRTFEQEARKREVKACTPYLLDEVQQMKPKWILGFGNEPLQALTGHSGIMKWRGRVMDCKEFPSAKFVATVSPAMVKRNPRQEQGWRADLQFFASQVKGQSVGDDRPPITVITNKEKLRALKDKLETAEEISYDVETTGFDEFDPGGAIVTLAGTLVHMVDDEELVSIFALPLYHPQSPFRKNWRKVLKYLAPALVAPRKRIAHNGKFDDRWLNRCGVPMDCTFDTMLAAHNLDENRVKGLKPLARILLGVPAWEISTKGLENTPLKEVLLYNGLDTFYTWRLYRIFRQQLIEVPRQLRIFKLLTMPASAELRRIEQRGVWCDPEKLATAYKVAFDTRDHIDEQLMEWVPDPDDPDISWPTNSKGKPVDVNFNPSNFAKWWLFDYLEMPIYERGKDKDDDTPGDPSMREAVMLRLKETKHPVIELLLERSKWQKYCSSYVSAYREVVDANDRIHTTFKLAGTVTGRLSSGKADEEKISSRRDRGRGVNLQQVPRDPFIRGLFGAPPDWSFVEADFSQIELRLAAFMAREPTMLRLYRVGADIHRYMAARVLGVPESQVTKDQRKKLGKPVNFGFVYGMYPKKFIQSAWENQELVFSLAEATAFRQAYFEEFPKLLKWHARQRRIVHERGRVQSPMGRVRHLPDIYSEDKFVVMEAERQAINSPVQAMASDMNLLSMNLLSQQFRSMGLRVHVLGVVHDAVNFEIHNDDLAIALPIIKDTMENLPLKRMFGVDIDIPIISDLQVGSHWGTARELEEDQIYNFNKYRDELTVRDS